MGAESPLLAALAFVYVDATLVGCPYNFFIDRGRQMLEIHSYDTQMQTLLSLSK